MVTVQEGNQSVFSSLYSSATSLGRGKRGISSCWTLVVVGSAICFVTMFSAQAGREQQ